MTKRADILSELRQITGTEGQFIAENPYRVPTGYFDYLPEALLRRIKADESVFGSAFDELESLSPLLAKLDKKMPFTVPDNYFETPVAVPMFTNAEKPVLHKVPAQKVVHLSFARKTMRFAVAAAVIGMIALGSWFLTRDNSTGNQIASAQEVILDVQKLSDTEITAYVESSANAGSDAAYQSAPASDEINNEDIKLLLADVSDEDLQLYIDQGSAETPELN